MIKRPFILKGLRIKECLELVHSDAYETFSIHTWGQYGVGNLGLLVPWPPYRYM